LHITGDAADRFHQNPVENRNPILAGETHTKTLLPARIGGKDPAVAGIREPVPAVEGIIQ